MRLGDVLLSHRLMNRLGVREMAREIGISAPTLSRVERDEEPGTATFLKILDWLTQPQRERKKAA